VFISIGLLVSVLGAYLAWSLICAEVLFAASKTRDMPRIFARENDKKVPAAALWMTNIVVQLFVISTYWSQDAFAMALSLTSMMSLIPFFLVAGYATRFVGSGATYDGQGGKRRRDMTIAILALIYTAFLIFAAGMKYVLFSAILYGPGTLLYFWAQKEQGRSIMFKRPLDWALFVAAVVGCIAGIYGLAAGWLTL
jgi:arginine:ornithine antiporter/lysine permease